MGELVKVMRCAVLMALCLTLFTAEVHGKTQRFCGFTSKLTVSKIRCSSKHVGKLASLRAFDSLRELNFTRSGLRSLDKLPTIPSLRALSLNYTRVRSLQGLVAVASLEELDLSNTNLKSLEGIEHLAEVRNLTLWNLAISDLRPLVFLTKLESLVLGGSKVKNLKPLEGARSLRLVNLEHTAVESLDSLKKIGSLRKVFLSGTFVTRATLDDFRRARPKVQLIGCEGKGSNPCELKPTLRPKVCDELLRCCDLLKKKSATLRKRCSSVASTLEELAKGGGQHPGLMTQICEHTNRDLRKELGGRVPTECKSFD